MTNKPKISRQERALTQRQGEFERYSAMTGDDLPHDGTIRNDTTPEDKANKASVDVTNLKNKLKGVAQ